MLLAYMILIRALEPIVVRISGHWFVTSSAEVYDVSSAEAYGSS